MMVMIRIWSLLFVLTAHGLIAQQDLSIGSWKSYLPYNKGLSVAQSPSAVFFGTEWSLLKVNKEDLSLEYFSKVEGLSDIGIQSLTYGKDNEVLIVTYTNSNIDLIFEDEIFNLNQIKNNTQIVGDRSIRGVHIQEPYAYLACGFGLVQLAIDNVEFGFTAFTDAIVHDVIDFRGELLITTEDGLFGVPNDGSINLADFSAWTQRGFSSGLPVSYRAGTLEKAGGTLYVGIDNSIYCNMDGRFERMHEEPGFELTFVAENETGLLTGWKCLSGCNAKKILIDPNGAKQTISQCTSRATDAVVDEQSRVWYADENSGFKFSQGFVGQCTTIRPDKPPTHNATDMASYERKLYVASGGVTLNYGYLFRAEGMYTNANGTWESINRSNNEVLKQKDMRDFLSMEIDENGTVFVGTFWDGLVEYRGEEVIVYDKDNSSLQNSVVNPDRNRVTGMAFDADGNLWALNHDAPNPLSVKTPDGMWKNFSLPTKTNVEHIAIDQNGFKWIGIGGTGLIIYDSGIDLFSTADDRTRLLNSNNSGLTVNFINDITVDLDGAVWVGTTSGLLVFDCGASAFEDNCLGMKLIVTENGIPGPLLGDENVKSIAVDGGNRKWFGTNNGVFVQRADARSKVARFNINNSPLFDNGIVDIAVDEVDGEIFIATNKGILSYRGEAVEGTRYHTSEVLTFPNPVQPGYDGPIAIKGLAENANVKITDIHGRLVFETTAQGGQAIWYGRDFDGNRAASGVYLVFSTAVNNVIDPDAAVAKIMLVN
ncbi:MAG: hypothetical protein HKN87_14120 [Saprospiraceae bacterium]|nr:hypothetical protein [Saprospiraceae bacterium]